MTKDEAWQIAVDRYILHHVADNYSARQAISCLEEARGNISRAIALAAQGDRCMFGNWGCYSPKELDVLCRGAFPSTPIQVWIHPHKSYGRDEPDLVITWREIFEYIRDGHRTVQLSMFEEVR